MFRIPLQKTLITKEEKAFAFEALEESSVYPFGQGVDGFRKGLVEHFGVQNVVPVASGTAALHLGLLSLGIGKGDTVICPDLNFAAGPNVIFQAGAEPIFVDVENETWGLDPELLESTLAQLDSKGIRPKAIMLIHAFGLPAKLGELMKISDKWAIPLIEDAAGAFGSIFKGKAVGTFGKVGVTSFNGNKIITTGGGGALISDDPRITVLVEQLANQGKSDTIHYEHSVIGHNYRLSNLNASLGLGQLMNLESRIKKKADIHKFYEKAVAEINGITMMPHALDGTSNHWMNVIQIDSNIANFTAHDLLMKLRGRSIEAVPMWKPMSQQRAFEGVRSFLNGTSRHLFDSCLCLPSGNGMTEEDLVEVVEALKQPF